MKHSTMEEILMINLNNKNWSSVEGEEIIERAVEKYLQKWRTTVNQLSGPPEKRLRLDDAGSECSEDFTENED